MPISCRAQKAEHSAGASFLPDAARACSKKAPRQCVRMPGKPRSSPAAKMGEQPKSRARSQADVVTEPPAPSLPLPPTTASSLSPRGNRELHRRICPPAARALRNTRGCVDGSATRNDAASAPAQSREREAQYCGSTTTPKSGLTPAARHGPREVFTAMTSMRLPSSRSSGAASSSVGPPARTRAGRPAKAPESSDTPGESANASMFRQRFRTQSLPNLFRVLTLISRRSRKERATSSAEWKASGSFSTSGRRRRKAVLSRGSVSRREGISSAGAPTCQRQRGEESRGRRSRAARADRKSRGSGSMMSIDAPGRRASTASAAYPRPKPRTRVVLVWSSVSRVTCAAASRWGSCLLCSHAPAQRAVGGPEALAEISALAGLSGGRLRSRSASSGARTASAARLSSRGVIPAPGGQRCPGRPGRPAGAAGAPRRRCRAA